MPSLEEEKLYRNSFPALLYTAVDTRREEVAPQEKRMKWSRNLSFLKSWLTTRFQAAALVHIARTENARQPLFICFMSLEPCDSPSGTLYPIAVSVRQHRQNCSYVTATCLELCTLPVCDG